MVKEDRYCVDILAQTVAVRAAHRTAERLILGDHSHACVEAAIAAGDPAGQRETFDEVGALLQKAQSG